MADGLLRDREQFELYVGLVRQRAVLSDVKHYFDRQGMYELAEEVAGIRDAVKLEANLLLERLIDGEDDA